MTKVSLFSKWLLVDFGYPIALLTNNYGLFHYYRIVTGGYSMYPDILVSIYPANPKQWNG